MSKFDVTFNLECWIREDTETASFVTYCPALDLYSQGRTRAFARRAMRSAVEMYVRICYERNILGKLLHKRGFEAVSTTQSATESGGAPDQTMEHITIVEDMVTQQGTQRIAYDDMFKIGVPMHLIAGQHAAKASSCLQS